MPSNNEDLEKLESVLQGFADLIREGEGTSEPVVVSSMRERVAAMDMAQFTVDGSGLLTGYTVKNGSEDLSEPTTTLEYFEKLMTNYADKVRVGQEKLDVDDIKAQEALSCGLNKDTYGRYVLRLPNSVTDLDASSLGSTSYGAERQKIKKIENLPSGLTEIKASVFYKCSSLSTFNIPSSVTTIRNNAFNECSSLKFPYIPKTVETIENYGLSVRGDTTILCASETQPAGWSQSWKGYGLIDAIWGCDEPFTDNGIKYVTSTIDNNSTGYLLEADNTVPATLTIPASIHNVPLQHIRQWAFNQCTSLQSVTVPEGVLDIGQYAFYNCSALTSVSLPSTCTALNTQVFADCSNLTTISIPGALTYIGDGALSRCNKLTSLNFSTDSQGYYCRIEYPSYGNTPSTFPTSLTRLNSDEDGVFKLQHVDLSSFRFADNRAEGPAGMTTLILDDVILSEYNTAGSGVNGSIVIGCSNLTSVQITNSKTEDNDAPVIWQNNTAIADHGSNDKRLLFAINGASITSDITSICPNSCMHIRFPFPANNWQNVTNISSRAFCGATFAQGAYLPNCRFIGEYAFSDATIGAGEVVLEAIQEIGSYAFDDSNLTSIEIPDTIQSIGYGAFDGCHFNDSDGTYASIVIHYNGSLEDLANDDTFKSNVLESFYYSDSYWYIKIIDNNSDEAIKRAEEWYNGGGGSGGGSGW